MIELPANFVTDLVTNTTDQLSNLSSYTTTIMGILLALLLIGGLVALIRHH